VIFVGAIYRVAKRMLAIMFRLIADIRVTLNWSALMVVSQVTGAPLASPLTTGTSIDSTCLSMTTELDICLDML